MKINLDKTILTQQITRGHDENHDRGRKFSISNFFQV
jgi:hypothetical protein